MTSSDENIVYKEISMESVDRKGSFDAEFNLLESNLVQQKDEHTNKNSLEEVFKGQKCLIERDSECVNPNDSNQNSLDCELSDRCSPKSKDFNKLSSPFIHFETKSQHCESVNVTVSDNLIETACKAVVSQEVDNIVCSSIMVKDSNHNFSKCNELQSSQMFDDDHVYSDTVISICDSSVEQYVNNQCPSIICNNVESKVTNEMDLESNIHDCDNTGNDDYSKTNSPSPASTDMKFGISDFVCHVGIPSSSCSELSDNHNVGEKLKLQSEENSFGNTIGENSESVTSQTMTNGDFIENKSVDINLSSEETITGNDIVAEGKNISVPSEEMQQSILSNDVMCNKIKCHKYQPVKCEEIESSRFTPIKNKQEDLYELKQSNQETAGISEKVIEICQENSNIFSSTPVVSNCHVGLSENKQTPKLSDTTDFGKISPLDLYKKKRKDLKRKHLNLQSIDEVTEDDFDSCEEKKKRCMPVEENDNVAHSETGNEENISSSTSYLEAPAKSILKKLQTSTFSTFAGTSYLVVDECGESDEEETEHIGDKSSSSAPADDFEIACNSLKEELMKEESCNERLEEHCSKILLENQMDDIKFEEAFQELISNFEKGNKATVTVDLSDEASGTKSQDISTSVKDVEVGDSNPETNTTLIKNTWNSKENLVKNIDPDIDCSDTNDPNIIVKVKENIQENADKVQTPISSSSTLRPDQSGGKEKNLTILYADGEDMAKDEEDVLLAEDTSTKRKPYVFFEFVSSDPQENEDNYNPEWQKLGRLTTDEERYKAVRDRWRSLVPPDPNRDLTCRQWREKNKKPPLNLSSRNNNYHMHNSNERNRLCTAVFQMKIKNIEDELQATANEMFVQRQKDFENLAKAQDNQQTGMVMRGFSNYDVRRLRKQHIQECIDLKNQYASEMENIKRNSDQKIEILQNASEEVLLFQKFYKGFGASDDDESCLYMTDVQVQELKETEDMLEQYKKFYK